MCILFGNEGTVLGMQKNKWGFGWYEWCWQNVLFKGEGVGESIESTFQRAAKSNILVWVMLSGVYGWFSEFCFLEHIMLQRSLNLPQPKL